MHEPKSISDIIAEGIQEITNADPVKLNLTPDEIRERAQRAEVEREQRSRRLEAIEASVREAREKEWADRVPPIFRVTLDDLPDDLRSFVSQWLARPKDERGTILLGGPVGVGKTYVGYAAAREAFLEGQSVVVHEVPTFLGQLIGPDSEATLQGAMNADVLFLDELKFHAKQADKDESWAAEKLLVIIDHRWKWQKPMIVTTNIVPSKFVDTFGERITSRLLYKMNQPGGTMTKRVTGVDRRITG